MAQRQGDVGPLILQPRDWMVTRGRREVPPTRVWMVTRGRRVAPPTRAWIVTHGRRVVPSTQVTLLIPQCVRLLRARAGSS